MHQVKKVRLDYLGLEEAVVSVENLEDLGSKAKRARLVKVDPLEIKVHQDQKVLLDFPELLVDVEYKGYWAQKVRLEELVHLAYKDLKVRQEAQEKRVHEVRKVKWGVLVHQAFEDPQAQPEVQGLMEDQELKVHQDKVVLRARKEMLAHQAYKVFKDLLGLQEEVRLKLKGNCQS